MIKRRGPRPIPKKTQEQTPEKVYRILNFEPEVINKVRAAAVCEMTDLINVAIGDYELDIQKCVMSAATRGDTRVFISDIASYMVRQKIAGSAYSEKYQAFHNVTFHNIIENIVKEYLIKSGFPVGIVYQGYIDLI